MNLTICGHHLEVTPALRNYVTTKLDRITRHFDQVGIHLQVGVAQQRHATLPGADKLAGAADMQVLAGDLEAVGVLENDLQPLAGDVAQRPGIDQHTTRFVLAAADPAAQLVQL